MSEMSETSNDQFLKTVKRSLMERRLELERDLGIANKGCKKVLTEAGSSVATGLYHQADNEAVGFTTDINLKSDCSMRIKKQIEDIDEALLRLSDGIYGQCEECGEDIEGKRLALNLSVKRCTPCEKELERKRRPNGLPISLPV